MKTYLNTSWALILLIIFSQQISFAQDPNFHIYLSFGQSNMAGAGNIETQDRTVDSRFQFMKPQDCSANGQYAGNWYKAIPPLWGCSGGIGPSDYFGRTMVANLPANIKVGVAVVGIPGCKIELFGKTGYAGLDTYNNVPAKYGGSAYAWLLALAKETQKTGVIKGILLHQGESNTGDQTWPNKVKGVYDNLIKDLNLDPTQTPLLAGELLYQDQGGVCWGHNSVIAKLPSVIPNAHVISAKGLPGQDIYHFNSAGNRTFGIRYAEKLLAIQPVVSTPSISFTAPATNSIFTAGSNIEFAVLANSPGGSISNVKFYNGSTLLNTDNTAPYSYTWTNVAAGSYTIRAIATDNQGKTGEITTTIKVNVPQGPYSGTWHAIPGTIQLENYDVGGNGIAYMDSSPGSEVTPTVNFRTDEDVDIENCTDAGGGYNIGFATAGEWLEYSVDVKTAGTYDIDLRVACSGNGRTVSVSIDGKSIANNVAIPNTNGWQAWQTTTVKNIDLKAGKQILRVTIGATDYVNLNFVTFKLTKELKQEPFNGTAHVIPGRIQAQDYDLGGEGLAYHEANTNGNEGGATYRNDEVDIETTQDVDGVYNIAYIMAGEWLEYTVNVTSDGVYDLDLRMAADGNGKILHVEMDGIDIIGAINVPNTGGWQIWQTKTVSGINLTAGEHIMRIAFESNYMNLNYVEFRDVITGTSNLASSAIEVFPNPFGNEGLLVKYKGEFEYRLTDVMGSPIESGQGIDEENVGKNLSKGTYILILESKSEKQIQKVLKY